VSAPASVSVLTRGSGIAATTGEVFLVGAIVKPTKASTPENPRYYHQLQLAPSADSSSGEVVYVFCEAEHMERAADKLTEANAAVPCTVELSVGRRGLNVERVTY
jgi:hypothetical protein